MQPIDVDPWQLAFAHAVHGRAVAPAPPVGKCVRIDGYAFRPGYGSRFARNAAAPVHDSAENIERQCTHCTRIDRHVLIRWDGWSLPVYGVGLTNDRALTDLNAARRKTSYSAGRRVKPRSRAT